MHYNWNNLAHLSNALADQNHYYDEDTQVFAMRKAQPMPMNMPAPNMPTPMNMPAPNMQVPNMQVPNMQLPNMQAPNMPTPMNMPAPMPIRNQKDPVEESPRTPTMIPGQEIYTYPQNLQGALKLIEEAVAGESEDRRFYQYLIDHAPSEEDKEIIRGIRENEITHFGLFRQIYSQLTGKMLPVPEEVPFEEPASYCEGIKRALKGEQNAVIKYRKILFAMQNRVHINMLTEIITDEIRHGILYNYLYTKNGCKV